MLNTDKESFAKLYDLCAPTAFGLARRMLGNEAEAEDAVQHAFISLWNHAAEFDADKGRVSTWLYAFVRNRCIDILRRRRREKAVSLNHDDESSAAPIDPPENSPTIEDHLNGKERRQLIANALRALPEPQRRVIEAAYFEGLTQQEIAEKLGEPLGTVKTRTRLGMLKLSDLLKDEAAVL